MKKDRLQNVSLLRWSPFGALSYPEGHTIFYPLARRDMFQMFQVHCLFQFVHLDPYRLNDLTNNSNDQTSL